MDREWTAKWIGPETGDTFQPVLFKDFYIDDRIKSATLYIASTGLFEAYINGRRVGNEYLLPYPGRTKSEIPYFVYDVTDYLNSGRESDVNSVDVFLGPGWESDDLPYALKAEFEVEVYKESEEENDLAETDGSEIDGLETYISETDGPETYGSEIDDLEAYISETDDPEMYGSGTDDMGVDDPETDDLMDVGFLDELDFEKEDTLSDQPSASGKIFLLARKGAHRSKPVKSPFALGDLDELDDFLAGVIDPTAAEEDDGEGEPNAPSVYRRSVTREKRRKPMFYTLEESETAETENAEISSEEKKNEADETTKDSLKEPEVFSGIIGEKTKALPESFEEESEEQPVSFEEEPEEQPESFEEEPEELSENFEGESESSEEEPEEQLESFEGEPEELPESFEDEPEILSEIIVEEPDATEENAESETAAEDDLEIFDFEDWDENTGTAVQTEEADETEDVTRKPDITLHVSPYQITEEQIEGLFDDGKKGAEAEEEISGSEADELSEEELTFEDEDADEEISAAEAEELAAGNERIEAKKAEIEAMIANFEFGSDSEENPEELEALLDELQIETELESSTVTEDTRLPEEMSRAAAETEPASEAEHEMEWAASEELEGSTEEELSELEALLDEIDLESEISEAEVEPAAEEVFERSAIPEDAEAESETETETEPAAEEAFVQSAMSDETETEVEAAEEEPVQETETEPAEETFERWVMPEEAEAEAEAEAETEIEAEVEPAEETFEQSAMPEEAEAEADAESAAEETFERWVMPEEAEAEAEAEESTAEETFERSAMPEEVETETEPAAAPGWTAPALAAGAALPAAVAFGLASEAAADEPASETEAEPAEETFEPEAMPEEAETEIEVEAETVAETAETDTEPEAPEAETEPAAEETFEPEAEAPEVDEYVPGGEEYISEEDEWDPEADADAFVQDFFGDEDAGFRTETDTILIVTDETWKYYASDIESSRPDSYEVFNRMLWDGARNPEKDVVVQEREIPLKKADHLPVVIKEELSVQEILYSPEGKPVLDFGRCFAGFLTFRSTLPRGTRVRFTFAEQQEEGRLLSADSSEGFYYVSDGVPEVVSSHFTSFLGRYVEIDGWTGELKPEDFTAMVLYADMERTGYAETSSEVLNRKFDDFLWNQKKESLMIPKDGTPEDVLAFSSGANYNMDTKDFLSAYLKELDAETLGDKGAFAAGLIWNLYQMSGDEELLSEHYELLTSWVRRLDDLDAEREEKEYLYDPDPAEDIWLSMDDETETAFLASAYYYDAAVIAGEAAAVLGKEQESYRFRRLAGRIKQAFLEEFFTASGRLAVDTQSAYILSLHLGLYIDKEKVKKALAARLEKDGKRMKCGSAAAPYFCRTLAENGMADVAYDVLLDPEPGRFANEIGFLYYSVAGIRPLEPGFSAVKLMPIPSGKLRSCSCSYQSAYGDIVSNWQIGDNGSLAFHFEIPEGITAKIALPYYPVCAAGGNEVTVKHGKYDYAYMPSVTL